MSRDCDKIVSGTFSTVLMGGISRGHFLEKKLALRSVLNVLRPTHVSYVAVNRLYKKLSRFFPAGVYSAFFFPFLNLSCVQLFDVHCVRHPSVVSTTTNYIPSMPLPGLKSSLELSILP